LREPFVRKALSSRPCVAIGVAESGLADFTFSGPPWRPCDFLWRRFFLKFLQDLVIENCCLNIGGQVLKAGGSLFDTPNLRRGKAKAGSLAVFSRDGVAATLAGPGMGDRRQSGCIHVFVKDSGLRMKRRQEESVAAFLWKGRCFPDAVVTCGQVRFDVHRAILVQNPVFKQGLSGNMVEARTGEFDTEESEPGAVEALLRHIYTWETDAPKNMLVPLLSLAAQYEEADLVQAVALALTDVSLGTVQARGRALKIHRDHPDVERCIQEVT